MKLTKDSEYKHWIAEVKTKIRSAQLKAALAVNSVLIQFYWDLGKMISEKQTAWGTKFLEQLSADLKAEFPEMQGFPVTNLKYCRLFNQFCIIRPRTEDELTAQNSPRSGDGINAGLNMQIAAGITFLPLKHIKLLIDKVKDTGQSLFYIGVSEFQLTGALPENLKSSLPTIEEMEQHLKFDNNEI